MYTKIFLADDHQVVLDGLKALLSSESDLRVVGEATDGLLVEPTLVPLDPDVLVLDLMMPGLSGLEVLRRVRKSAPRTKVIVLSMHQEVAYVAEALRGGASGYVLKQAHTRELLDAIRQVTTGRRYLSSPLSDELVADYERQAVPQAPDPYEMLTGREREVLQLAAEGKTSAEIAHQLAIGRRTIETHRANLMRKLGLKSHAELIKFAVRRGLVSVDA